MEVLDSCSHNIGFMTSHVEARKYCVEAFSWERGEVEELNAGCNASLVFERLVPVAQSIQQVSDGIRLYAVYHCTEVDGGWRDG